MENKYQETLTYLFEKLPMFTRIGAAAYKPNLDNIIALCRILDNPHLKFKSVHIAGTNGKGSCSHMLASIFKHCGYKTGLYTSPHIIDFRERIQINHTMIPKQYVVDFVYKIKPHIEEINPSFFEITVAMAFQYFAEQKVDIAIIEVGLGGLLDSTNIITPEVSVITNISYDHMNLLGQTLQEIAKQKAGIIKDKVPVVIGESQPELFDIFFAKAITHKSRLFYAYSHYETLQQSLNDDGSQYIKLFDNYSKNIIEVTSDLSGDYQHHNIKTVLTTIEVLRNQAWILPEEKVNKALSSVKEGFSLRGRFEIIQKKPYIILDVSHNEAGIKGVFKQISNIPHKNLYVIAGFAKDKIVEKIIQLFPKKAHYIFTEANIPRAMPSSDIEEIAIKHNLEAKSTVSISEAVEIALYNAAEDDIILVTGSFYILADVYEYFGLSFEEN